MPKKDTTHCGAATMMKGGFHNDSDQGFPINRVSETEIVRYVPLTQCVNDVSYLTGCIRNNLLNVIIFVKGKVFTGHYGIGLF